MSCIGSCRGKVKSWVKGTLYKIILKFNTKNIKQHELKVMISWFDSSKSCWLHNSKICSSLPPIRLRRWILMIQQQCGGGWPVVYLGLKFDLYQIKVFILCLTLIFPLNTKLHSPFLTGWMSNVFKIIIIAKYQCIFNRLADRILMIFQRHEIVIAEMLTVFLVNRGSVSLVSLLAVSILVPLVQGSKERSFPDWHTFIF